MSALPQENPQAQVEIVDQPAPLVQDEVNPDILPFVFTKKKYTAYRMRLWERDAHCTYCGSPMKRENSTLDHVLPKSQGGLDQPHNLVLSCERCNLTKAGRSAEEWRDHLIAACERIGGAR